MREGGQPEQQRKAAPGSEVVDLSNHTCRLPGEMMVRSFLILVVFIEVLVVWVVGCSTRLLPCLKRTHRSPFRTWRDYGLFSSGSWFYFLRTAPRPS